MSESNQLINFATSSELIANGKGVMYYLPLKMGYAIVMSF